MQRMEAEVPEEFSLRPSHLPITYIGGRLLWGACGTAEANTARRPFTSCQARQFGHPEWQGAAPTGGMRAGAESLAPRKAFVRCERGPISLWRLQIF